MDTNKQEISPLLESSAPRARRLGYQRSNTYSYGAAVNNQVEPYVLALPSNVGPPDEAAQSHCHEREQGQFDTSDGSNERARRTLIIASVLCLSFMVAEIVGGYLAWSLAIITDAAHLLTDFASFMISLFSLFLAARPATRRMSFGWHRAEVLGALVSVLMIWLVTGVLVYMAIMRIVNKDFEVDGKIMLITAALGVAVNLMMGFILHRGGAHGHSHGGSGGHHHDGATTQPIIDQSNAHSDENEDAGNARDTNGHSDNHDMESGPETKTDRRKRPSNINVQAAFIHVLGDFVQSIGVFVAAIVIYVKPHLGIIDPICTFIFSVLVLVTTVAIMRDALTVLMEGLPRGIDFVEVTESLLALDGVERVHDLRIWSLTMDKPALSVHLAVDPKQGTQIVLNRARELLHRRYNIYECTVQIEHYSNDMNECQRCEVPKV